MSDTSASPNVQRMVFERLMEVQWSQAEQQKAVLWVGRRATSRDLTALVNAPLPVIKLYIQQAIAEDDAAAAAATAAAGADRLITLDELIGQKLPDLDWVEPEGASRSREKKDRMTHPTAVEEWDCTLFIKQRLEQERGINRGQFFQMLGSLIFCRQDNEGMAVTLLFSTAAQRANQVLKRNNIKLSYQVLPTYRITKSQTEALELAKDLDEVIAFESFKEMGFPDIELVQYDGYNRTRQFCVECKSTWRLPHIEGNTLAKIWNARLDSKRPGSNTRLPLGVSSDLADNVVQTICQILGYMSRRGNKYGAISTYRHTYLLEVVQHPGGVVLLRISAAIPHSARSSPTQLSVTEAFVWAALDAFMTRGPEYPVARMPGGVAAGLDDVRTERRAVLEEVASQQQSEEAEVSGPAGGGADAAVRQQRGYTQANPLDLRSLRFIAKLGRCVFLGRLNGVSVAVRVARTAAEQADAMREVAAYERLSSIQGRMIPRLIAYGYALDGDGYFVATEYVRGVPWDGDSLAHQALSSRLRDALSSVHDLGVEHGDLHGGNILVAADGRVMLLDFEGAQLQAPAHVLEEEDRLLQESLAMKQGWDAVATRA